MNNEERTIKSEIIYTGRILQLEVATVELPDGSTSTRELIRHNGACAVLPVKDDKFIMVKQYRKALEAEILEIPAGKLEAGEDPQLCAIRELKEETGYLAGQLEPLHDLYMAAGYSSEVIHIYLAENLTFSEASPDEDEFVYPVEMDMDEVYTMIVNGEIKDAKTVCAVLKYYAKKHISIG